MSAQEDIKQIAGRCFGTFLVQDMTMGSQSSLHVGARGSVQVESLDEMHIDGPQVKQPNVAAPPPRPLDWTFAAPHPGLCAVTAHWRLYHA